MFYHNGMSDLDSNNQDKSSRIEVRSYKLVGETPLSKPVVHNEIVFIVDGRVVAAFNGDPYNRETGGIPARSYSNQDTLRVSVKLNAGTLENDPRNGAPLLATGVAFTGSREEILEKLGVATDAAHAINDSNIDYIMASIGSSPQNSNSVAATLLQSMGLNSPASLAGVWAPGEGRSLLPADFSSNFEGISQRDPDWARITSSEAQDLHAKLKELDEEKVRKKVVNDPNPHAADCHTDYTVDCSGLQGGVLFDEKQPSQSKQAEIRQPTISSSGPS